MYTRKVQFRIGKSPKTCNQLAVFWSKPTCETRLKLQICSAIFIVQLTYGLNTLSITHTVFPRGDAINMRGLSYVLKIEHSLHCSISNVEVLRRATITINKGKMLQIIGISSSKPMLSTRCSKCSLP